MFNPMRCATCQATVELNKAFHCLRCLTNLSRLSVAEKACSPRGPRCVECRDAKAEPGRIRCRRCLARGKLQQRARRKRLKDARACIGCSRKLTGADLAEERIQCLDCRTSPGKRRRGACNESVEAPPDPESFADEPDDISPWWKAPEPTVRLKDLFATRANPVNRE